ncbi:MAG TPA: porin family protein [Chryseolinea sp.]|nr:porin family protein [Chryseolinea sp.]
MKTTKTVMMAFLLLGISAGAFAQAQFAVGIKAGPNFSKINTEASAGENYDNRTGFNAGAFFLIRGERIGFQPEVMFSQQGSKFKVNTGDPSLEANFSYVNIPLIVKLYTVAGINLQVGPQIGFLTSAEKEDYASGQSGPITTEDIKSDLKKTDFSLALGVGWDLPLGFSIDGRYNWGLSDINNTNSGASSSTIKNQVWQISVGYKLFKSGEVGK